MKPLIELDKHETSIIVRECYVDPKVVKRNRMALLYKLTNYFKTYKS